MWFRQSLKAVQIYNHLKCQHGISEQNMGSITKCAAGSTLKATLQQTLTQFIIVRIIVFVLIVHYL